LICLVLTSRQARIVSRIAPSVASEGERPLLGEIPLGIAGKRGTLA
jgi:hypothetical protein